MKHNLSNNGPSARLPEQANLPVSPVPRTAKETRKRLRAFASKLRAKEFKSEVWLKEMWVKHKLTRRRDRWNKPVCDYIADLVNRDYAYIVEVDGSIHEQEWQKKKDEIKDLFLTDLGFRVFRIKAFDANSFWKTAIHIRDMHYRRKIP